VATEPVDPAAGTVDQATERGEVELAEAGLVEAGLAQAGSGEPADDFVPVPGGGLGAWIKLVFLVAVLVLGALFVARRWDELSGVLGELSWPAVVVAVPLAALAQLAAMQAYRAITADLGAPLPLAPAGRVYFVSQLGKYLPGTVWGMVALVTLSREYRVMRKTSLATGLLVLAFSVATAVLLAGLLLPFGALQSVRHFWYVGLLLPLALVGLHPRVVGTVLDWALRRIGRLPMPRRMSYAGTLRVAGWQSLCWLLYGLHAWALVLGVGGAASPTTLAVSIGGFALSYAIGPLFVLMPAAAGVRETAIVLTLGTAVGGTTALAVALVSRMVLVVIDFSQAGLWSIGARRTARAGQARARL
jgi:glycosyltransferase 2 family protein